MAPSKRPIVEKFDATWLGDPEGPDFSIEIADEYICLSRPSGDDSVRWDDIASLDIVIPTANWRLAKASFTVLSTLDMFESTTNDGVSYANDTRRGNSDIEVRIVRKDGTEVVGWARKHQPFGYPEPEAEAAKAVLQERVRNSGIR